MNNESAEPVLLMGTLTRKLLARAREEISKCSISNRPVELVINSDGGDLGATLEFLSWIANEKVVRQLQISAKIYTASSAAALIALATDRRIISYDNELRLHVGWIKVDYSDIGKKDGVVSNRFRYLLHTSRVTLFKLLSGTKLPSEKLSTLDSRGRLELKPAECVEYGICSAIF
jgi:ATP-dependent protease ClpP protease subunit